MTPEHLERELCDLDERITLGEMSYRDLVERVRLLEHRVVIAEHLATFRRRREQRTPPIHTFAGTVIDEPPHAYSLEARLAGARPQVAQLVESLTARRRARALDMIDEHEEARTWDEEQR